MSKPPYAIEYRYNGDRYSFTIWAESWEDAEDRLRAIGLSGRVYGGNVQRFPANSLTFPFMALWVRLLCWWRNGRSA